jgi:MFS transporter, UMF1 family
MPTFLILRERAQPQSRAHANADANANANANGISNWRASFQRLAHTWHEARHLKDFAWLLACGASYQSGITVVIALAAVYAEQVLGFRQSQTMVLVFLVNIASAVGAFGFGYWQDRLGHRRALAFTLMGWIVMTALAYLATGATLFWCAAVVAGLCMGSSQSAGRAMAGLLAPHERRAEFYALWTFATRLSAVVGPMTYGAVTWITAGNHRLAILTTGLYFVLGLLCLRPIDMARGMRAAELESK